VAKGEGEVQSVVRALGLLEAIAAAGEMGVTELARAQGLHVATAHNLLRTLAGRHYLINRGGRYRLGPAVAMLGAGWEPLHALPDLVQPGLVQIAEGCGEAASATILVGREARLIGFQPGTEAITIHYPQWLWPEALKLATGRLLVALGDPNLWPEFVEHSPGVRPGLDLAAWQRDLQRLRELGYCALTTNRDGGQTLIAAPLRGHGGRALAAVGAACPAFRATPERCRAMTEVVWRVAGELCAQLGGELPAGPPDVDWAGLDTDEQLDESAPTKRGQDPFSHAGGNRKKGS